MKIAFYLLMLVLVVFSMSKCTDEPEAERILIANGFTDIQFTGYSMFACSEDDRVHTGFIAKTATGASVKGTVCSGYWLKNSTIRFN